jgi:hypothetical protein
MRRTRNVGDWIHEAGRRYNQVNAAGLSAAMRDSLAHARQVQLCVDYGHTPLAVARGKAVCARCGAEVNTTRHAVVRAPGTKWDGVWYDLHHAFAGGSAELVDHDGMCGFLHLQATDEYVTRDDGERARVFEVYTPPTAERVTKLGG